MGNLIAVRLLKFSTLSQKCPSAALQAFDVRLFNEVQVLILQLSAQAGAEAGCRRPPTGRNSLPAGGNTTNQLPPPADRQEFPACRRKYYKPTFAIGEK
jgi:hypothetical protein